MYTPQWERRVATALRFELKRVIIEKKLTEMTKARRNWKFKLGVIESFIMVITTDNSVKSRYMYPFPIIIPFMEPLS